MFRVSTLNPKNKKICVFSSFLGKLRALSTNHVTKPGRLAQTHPRDGDDFNRMRSESYPRRHERKRRIAFGGRVRYFVAEFVDTGAR